MRIIKVKNCAACPHREHLEITGGGDYPACTIEQNRDLSGIKTFPKWCPLEGLKRKGIRKKLIKKCRKCGSRQITYIEYPLNDPDHYDGISEILCEKCGARFGRWTGKKLKDGETEKRYGGER